MTRTAEQIRDEWLRQLFPMGWAWPKSRTSNMAGLLQPYAALSAQFEADVASVYGEISPARSQVLLTDYEAVLGPDPCGRDALATTVALRRALAQQRWTQAGGQSIGFFKDMAAALGLTITIEEPEPAICGEAVCGVDVCSQIRDRWIWIVNILNTAPSIVPQAAICGVAVCGVSVCGDVDEEALANEFSLLSCPMQTLKPADTTLIIQQKSA